MNLLKRTTLVTVLAGATLILTTGVTGAATEGISQLIAATSTKSSNANDQALEGAPQQRGLIAKQEVIRAQQKQLGNRSSLGNGSSVGERFGERGKPTLLKNDARNAAAKPAGETSNKADDTKKYQIK